MNALEVWENLFFVQRGWLNGNHFVFKGEQNVLIDTGYVTDFEETRTRIESTGLELAEVDLIVNTHCHCDHTGGNRRIFDLSDCEIAIHPIEKGFIDARDGWETWYEFYDQEAEFFPVHRALEDGERLRLDGRELRVVHTPGHSRGGVSLYCPEDRFLISSDALWDGDLGLLNTIVEGSDAPSVAVESLERIAEMDIDRIYPGHGGVIEEPAEAIRRCREKLEFLSDDPVRLGNDHLKKILIFVLLMKRGCRTDGLFDYLSKTHWYPAVVDRYFQGRYRNRYEAVMEDLLERNIVRIEDGIYYANVPR